MDMYMCECTFVAWAMGYGWNRTYCVFHCGYDQSTIQRAHIATHSIDICIGPTKLKVIRANIPEYVAVVFVAA